MPEAELEPESDDSDFEFDGVRTKKGKYKKGKSAKPVSLFRNHNRKTKYYQT
jgi:hypothetical protein